MAIIVTKITTDAACQQSGPIIERALSQKKFRIPTLKAFFDDHIPQMPAPQYPQTLRAWREHFWLRLDEVKQLGCDDVFIRMWHYYLCFCEGGFMERVIHTGQFLMAKPGFRDLPRIH